MKILIDIQTESGAYTASYSDKTDPPPIVTTLEGDIEVDNHVIFEAIEHIKKAVKED